MYCFTSLSILLQLSLLRCSYLLLNYHRSLLTNLLALHFSPSHHCQQAFSKSQLYLWRPFEQDPVVSCCPVQNKLAQHSKSPTTNFSSFTIYLYSYAPVKPKQDLNFSATSVWWESSRILFVVPAAQECLDRGEAFCLIHTKGSRSCVSLYRMPVSATSATHHSRFRLNTDFFMKYSFLLPLLILLCQF